jgi:hypothetical protein
MTTCNVVRDLLPNYVDGLVSEKTAQEITAHLADCTDCKTAYEQMKTPLESIIAQDTKEIDYLKKIKTKSKMRVLKYSVICVAVVTIALTSIVYILATGTPVKSTDLQYSVHIDNSSAVRVDLSLEDSSSFFVRTNVIHNEKTGQMEEFTIYPRQVPERFASGNLFGYEYIPDNGLSENFRVVIKLSDKDLVLTADKY